MLPFANSLDPDQARQNARPDLGPNCLQRLSADDTRRQRVKVAWLTADVVLFNDIAVVNGKQVYSIANQISKIYICFQFQSLSTF